MKTSPASPRILSENLFPVIGIGASAGGLDAFKRLIKSIPAHSGMAYVLVQHLDPDHDSILAALLQKVTAIPVSEITDDVKVEPDHIYIIPSNKTLKANDGVLELTPRSKAKQNLCIDLFFTSLAEVHRTHAIGVVLTGNGSDGTAGLKAIKEYGGTTFAQGCASATHGSMPGSAVAAGVVDYVMSPEEIPGKLEELKKGRGKTGAKGPVNGVEEEELIFKEILALLHNRKGTDFTYYKRPTLRRRIQRRMALNKHEKPAAYLHFLKETHAEQDTLYQDLLIPVTSFFRDKQVFDELCKTVFPALLKNKAPNEPVRIWVASCSTGQEAYSMAICIKELLGDSAERVQVFATDISEPAIARARKGVYSKAEVEGVSPERLARFFTPAAEGYSVAKEIRDRCVFALHNFLSNPPFSKIDFISCRNVLIYMEPYLQKRALTTFHYSLNPKGFLLLGASETGNGTPELFAPAGKTKKFFTRKDVPGRFTHVSNSRKGFNTTHPSEEPPADKRGTDFHKTTDDLLLSRYMPSGVVINERGEIVEFRGDTGLYLVAPPGKPSHHLLKMARNGLSFELRSLLQKASKEGLTVYKEAIPLAVGGKKYLVRIDVVPLPNMVEAHHLILFQQQPVVSRKTTAGKEGGASIHSDEAEERIVHLEHELAQTREDMRHITQEQEATNEELQSANEELLSGNEELQSLNEELETGKEELQSSNEGLTLLNQEITAARLYAEAIVATIREPVLVLDKNLRVRTANASFYSTFKVAKQQTETLLVYDLANKQWDIPALRTLLEEILPQQTRITDFEVRHNFQVIGERIMLLNAMELKQGKDEEKLILLAIKDITSRVQLQQIKIELLNGFRDLVMQTPVPMMILKGGDYHVELANDSYLALVEQDDSFLNKPLFESLPELETQGIRQVFDSVLKNGMPYHGKEVEIRFPRNKKKQKGYFNFVYQPLREINSTVSGIIVVANEVTEQVLARKSMEAQATMVKNLMMSAPGFICTLTGPNHVYTLVNERYQQLFGKRQIQGKPIMEALPELVGQDFDTLLDQVYTTGLPYVGFDIPITLARDEGLKPEMRYFNFSYQPVFDEHQHIQSILVFGYEVTEEVNAKNKILQMQQEHNDMLEWQVNEATSEIRQTNSLLRLKNDELLKMNLELESFTYVCSHDLQEPLRKIQTYASRLRETEHDCLSERGLLYFEKIQAAAHRMRVLIDDLLAYSHTDIPERRFTSVSLDDLVMDVRETLSQMLAEKGGTLEAEGLGNVLANGSQLRQVFTNLVSNALKFSKPHLAPVITITTRVVAHEAMERERPAIPPGFTLSTFDYCCISIADNGIGFDPNYGTKIFEVFQRLHSKEAYSGTGIGLAIVKKIIDHHAGFITADSKKNVGSVFKIYLPIG